MVGGDWRNFPDQVLDDLKGKKLAFLGPGRFRHFARAPFPMRGERSARKVDIQLVPMPAAEPMPDLSSLKGWFDAAILPFHRPIMVGGYRNNKGSPPFANAWQAGGAPRCGD